MKINDVVYNTNPSWRHAKWAERHMGIVIDITDEKAQILWVDWLKRKDPDIEKCKEDAPWIPLVDLKVVGE